MLKPIPQFHNEDEEREFWNDGDSTDYLDWRKSKQVIFPKLKPSVKKISIQLPESMLNELYLLANKQSVSYQDLIKIFLRERIDSEFHKQVVISV